MLSLSFLKNALISPNVRLDPSKQKWLVDNAPLYFNHRQGIVLAYVQAKLKLNPEVKYRRALRTHLRVTEADVDIVESYLNATGKGFKFEDCLSCKL